MPAYAADGQALRRTPPPLPNEQNGLTPEMVVGWVRANLGIVIVGPFHYWRPLQPDGRAALIVFHRYSAPAIGEAEIIVCSERFLWTRKMFQELAFVCIDTLGIRRLLASVPVEATRLPALLVRAGFKHECTRLADDGRAYDQWSLLPASLLALGRTFIRTLHNG
jgi:hypothetical protein